MSFFHSPLVYILGLDLSVVDSWFLYDGFVSEVDVVFLNANIHAIRYYGPGAMPTDLSPEVMAFGPAAEVMTPMGTTSENVAAEFGIGRAEQGKL